MTETAILPLNAVQTAILDTLLHHRADWPLSAAGIFERCDDVENIAAVHTALHVLHRRGLIVRESCTPDKGKPYYVYRAPGLLESAPDHVPVAVDMDAPIDAEWPDALEQAPASVDFTPLVDYLTADLGAAAGLDFEPYPDDSRAPAGFDPRAPADIDPVLSDIAALRAALRAPRPVWTEDDIRWARALAETLADHRDFPAAVSWLYTVAARMLGEDQA